MNLWTILLALGAAAAPIEERQELSSGIFLRGLPANSPPTTPTNQPGTVNLGMGATARDRPLAYHNGKLPYAGTFMRRMNNHNEWYVAPSGETALRTRDDFGSEFCLDAGSYPAAGNKLHVWQCYGGLTQQTWVIEPFGDPWVSGRTGRIKLRDFDLCLDRGGRNGNPVVQPCADTIEQIWVVRRSDEIV